ncbi:DUF4118 domain-containing protein [Actinopolymorpha alba]|uniref:sensor histidine kinase n=1 Tax=Actinopolymorpha alba TaxID=533267 RepID=UPI0003641CC8|nr:DUF4118 domain-containing protein [Actinopolymorpha alba]
MARYAASLPVLHWLSGLLVSAALVAAFASLIVFFDPYLPGVGLEALYILVILAAATIWGTGLAVVAAVLSALVYEYLFVPPIHTLTIRDPLTLVVLIVFVITAVVVGQLAGRMRRAAEESARLAEEQSALRRVATLAAKSVSPSAVFEAVAREVGRQCNADLARLERYEEDGTVTGVAVWSSGPAQQALGTRFELEGLSIAREVRQTGDPVRIESFVGATGAIAEESRALGIRSSVGCPIVVAGSLWGVIAASTRNAEPFPPDTEAQIARFTEIVATAIANAESREQLAASRARVVAAGDDMRRRLERDLHDGVQQRLVSLGLELRFTQETVPAELPALRGDIGQVADEITEVLDELRETTRGIHPAILSQGGLGPALRTLARRSAVPVELSLDADSRYSPPVEVAAYYVVSEALTNTIKHANASHAAVFVEERDSTLRLRICDDGVGGAVPQRGSGLIGLYDRVEALGGSIDVVSPTGHGTRIQVSLPLEQTDGGPPPVPAVGASSP